jgi:hypothetical protein
MVDLSTPLIAATLGLSLLSTQLSLGGRPPVGWLLIANSLALACLCLLYFAGVELRAPVPEIVPQLLLAMGLVLTLASGFFYIRNDARRLREKAASSAQ